MSSIERGSEQDKPWVPNWKKWAAFIDARLPDAVALSCNIEPDIVRAFGDSLLGQRVDPLDVDSIRAMDAASYVARVLPEELQSEFIRRLEIAINHVEAKRLVTAFGSIEGSLRLSDFAQWARGVGMALPPEFPAPARPKKPDPLNTKERTTLLVVIGALARKAGIDVEKPTTAAKAIVNALQEMGVQIGQRTVEECLKEIPDALDRKGY